MTNLIASLPASERARLYREMAAETRRRAETVAVPDARATFLTLSVNWNSLAEELCEEAGVEVGAAG